jgi:hypothetical protein
MNEWGVVVVLVTLAGLAVTVGKPILSLNTAIVKLTAAVEGMKEENRALRLELGTLEQENRESHRRLHGRLDAQGSRITVLEQKRGGVRT